ncbi:flagellar biosynthesis protein FlgN [Buchnera aphidicola (Hyperomyzus lactucae)]|uniref:Flagellar biosynthesis protein FlgN n=1 Tax=Buchnera aphidicola (Hyperomyzus lactucae) TaxID=1241860 RepID=A0A4D6XUS9_9GAMM|nr:flagellar export chaperone FlgN [Buchnera aphidicola]QCI21056.1 flagellar biosynthesis protein FlgN [Buchnera aphidicola (Hyperomyzus lactucae)]
MNNLIDTIKKIENILSSLGIILNQEYYNLLHSYQNGEKLELTKKKILLKKYFLLNKNRIVLEKKYGIFAPYKNNYQLHNYWNKIVKQCLLLRELNLKNKILINKKFYLNQYFLELLPSYKTCITYNIKGNLKN